jgi:CHAT domain-containing protein
VIGEFSALHLGAHGTAATAEDPFAAGLRLPDGIIDGYEISQWRLAAEFVALSACNLGQRATSTRHVTPRPDSPSETEDLFGDEVFGVQAAFFAAGAREVLGALWPVTDEIAPRLLGEFYDAIHAGLPRDVGLKHAICAERAREDRIYRWAPFALFSIGRSSPPRAVAAATYGR